MCSIGLGGKRRSKPPSQKRDIRPGSKLPRIESPPPLPPCSRASYTPPPFSSLPSLTPPHTTPPVTVPSTNSQETRFVLSSSPTFNVSSHNQNSLLPLSGGVAFSPPSNSLSVANSPVFLQTTEIAQTRSASTPLIAATQKDVVVRGSATATLHKSGKKPRALPVTLNSAVALVDPLANLYTIAEACLLNSPEITASSSTSSTLLPQPSRANPEMSVASEVTVSDSSGLQIFTTINEPYFESHKETASGGPQSVSAVAVDQQTAVGVTETIVSGEVEEQYVVQGSSSPCGQTAVEPSIYQLLFQLPSVPNSTLCTAVVCLNIACCREELRDLKFSYFL